MFLAMRKGDKKVELLEFSVGHRDKTASPSSIQQSVFNVRE